MFRYSLWDNDISKPAYVGMQLTYDGLITSIRDAHTAEPDKALFMENISTGLVVGLFYRAVGAEKVVFANRYKDRLIISRIMDRFSASEIKDYLSTPLAASTADNVLDKIMNQESLEVYMEDLYFSRN